MRIVKLNIDFNDIVLSKSIALSLVRMWHTERRRACHTERSRMCHTERLDCYNY